jgi:hypothetical protein
MNLLLRSIHFSLIIYRVTLKTDLLCEGEKTECMLYIIWQYGVQSINKFWIIMYCLCPTIHNKTLGSMTRQLREQSKAESGAQYIPMTHWLLVSTMGNKKKC